MFKSVSRNSKGRAYFLPELPTLFDDECLSSWLRRCAYKYRFKTSWDFILGLLALDRLTLEAGPYDWDTAPPLVVLQILEERTGVAMERLTQRLSTPEFSLRPGEKDAYCPECFVEDVAKGEVYVRREWINPWIVSCSRHRCPLGCYAARSLETRKKSPQALLWQELTPVGKVYPVHTPAPFWLTSGPRVEGPLELNHDWQRRLMLTLGLPVGKRLLYALTTRVDVEWLTDSAETECERHIRAPRAKIGWRVDVARAVKLMGTMARPNTLALQDPRQLVPALISDLARSQNWGNEFLIHSRVLSF